MRGQSHYSASLFTDELAEISISNLVTRSLLHLLPKAKGPAYVTLRGRVNVDTLLYTSIYS